MNNLYFLLFIVLTINLYPVSKNWYVSTSSSGNASGDNWTNKKALKSFDPRTLAPGDTLFIDGGASGLTYNEASTYHSSMLLYVYDVQGTASDKIVITRGKDAGHNGVPFFTSTSLYGMYLNKSEYIEISHLKFGQMGDTRTQLTLSGELGNPRGIDILYNEFNYVSGTAIDMAIAYDIRILHNTFTSGTNGQTLSNDAVKSAGGITNLEIAYNTFEGNSNSTSAGNHTDFLQASGGTQGIMKIHHNFYVVKSGSYQGIYGEYTGGIWYIYNNIFLWENSADGELAPVAGSIMNLENQVGGNNVSGNLSIHFYNNTVIMGDGTHFGVYAADTINFKNNLFKSYANPIYASLNVTGSNTVAGVPKSVNNYHFDYNIYEKSSSPISVAGITNWTTWTTTNAQDANSTYNTSTFDLIDETSYTATDYMLDAASVHGIDDGTNLSDYFTDDYSGTARPQGATWDIGAFEYFENSSSNINLRGKLLLQGPFDSNSMMTNLVQNGLLPNTQPFNTAPWNYDGSESLSTSSTSSYVDWVLVELRNSSDPTQVVARSAAILKNDGTLLNTDGNAGVPFNSVQEGSYYIAIFHRNHLAIMSAAPVQLSANSQIYDFSSGMNKAYGTNPMVNLGDGKFGMYVGDGNSNGGITITDRNEVWLPQNGTLGYLNGDFNLDGGVTIHDVNLYWNINNGTMTQVP